MNTNPKIFSHNAPGKPGDNKEIDVYIRNVQQKDGRNMWDLVKNTYILDLNSVYCYLLLCRHFRNTCMVAETDNSLAGFVTAYQLPENDKILFIWQIGIKEEYRKRGLAKKLILELLNSKHCKHIEIIQATVSPSNTASLSLFNALARDLETSITQDVFFDSSLFPNQNHGKENLLAVGPFTRKLFI